MAIRPAVVSLKDVHQFINEPIYSFVGGVLVAGNPKAYPMMEPASENKLER